MGDEVCKGLYPEKLLYTPKCGTPVFGPAENINVRKKTGFIMKGGGFSGGGVAIGKSTGVRLSRWSSTLTGDNVGWRKGFLAALFIKLWLQLLTPHQLYGASLKW